MEQLKNGKIKKDPIKVSTNGAEIVRDLMKKQGITMVDLAESLDYNSNQAVYRRLKDENMKLSTFFRFLKAMNYRIVVEPDVGTIGDGNYRVDGVIIDKPAKDGDSE